MKVEEYDSGRLEREVLIGMITDDSVCGRVASQWKKEPLFASPSANVFGSLCVKLYRRHGKAPGLDSLRRQFIRWCENRRDEESVRSGERYWSFLQEDVKRSNGSLHTEHIIDLAGELFEGIAQDNLAEKIKAYREAGQLDKAREAIINYRKIELGVGAGEDPYRDREAVKEYCNSREEPLIVYPGALKHFFSQTLERGRLVAFCAPEKTGKSYWMLDLAVRAAEQGRRVVYFECGDMVKNEVYGRLFSRHAQRPVKPSNREDTWPCDVRFPELLNPPAKHDAVAAEVDFRLLTFKKAPSEKQINRGLDDFMAGWGDEESRIRFYFHPSGTLSVGDISSVLDGLALDGWLPDVIVVDYADILADPPGHRDFRHCIAKNWEGLRSLSMARHALVVTATQANREAYDKPFPLNRKNISEDKRKLAYVSAMAGINVIPDEKKDDQCRLNWVSNRGKQTTWTEVVHVAGCLALANPCVLSIFP